jgi:hypothetical protein
MALPQVIADCGELAPGASSSSTPRTFATRTRARSAAGTCLTGVRHEGGVTLRVNPFPAWCADEAKIALDMIEPIVVAACIEKLADKDGGSNRRSNSTWHRSECCSTGHGLAAARLMIAT